MKKFQNILDHLPIDNKLIIAGVTYLLTLLVTRVGLDLTDWVIPGYLNLAQVIALAAASVAGYFQPNTATELRGDNDGNPDPVLVEQHLGT